MDEETGGLPSRDSVIFGEIQVLLAEKRTALASLRTGIAVFALPLSVLSALIATSRYYSIEKVMPLLAPLMLLNLGLGRAGLLAGVSFHPPYSPLRASYPGAQREISVHRAVYGVAPTNLRLNPQQSGSMHRSFLCQYGACCGVPTAAYRCSIN